MDHFATRYPTNIIDIANFLVRLSGIPHDYHPELFAQRIVALQKPLPPILHYSAAEPYTKYEICLVFAKLLGLPHKHIIPQADPPADAGATKRPRNCQLDTRETEGLVGGGLDLSLFEEWWTEYLQTKKV